MPRILCIIGLVISCLIALLFLLDMAAGVPFNRHSMLMDGVFLVSALVFAFLSFQTYRELR